MAPSCRAPRDKVETTYVGNPASAVLVRSLNKLPLLALASLLLVAPAAAQGLPGGSASVAIEGLPASQTVAGKDAVLDVDIHVTGSGIVCIGTTTASFPVQLTAQVTGNASAIANVTARVSPASMVFRTQAAPALGQVGGAMDQTQGATIIVQGPDYMARNVTVSIVATLTAPSNCGAAGPDAGAPAQGEADLVFTQSGPPTSEPSGEKMPGLELGILVAAIALVALRRKQ